VCVYVFLCTGDHDAEHRPLDVRGCHAVGGQLLLWPDMKPASSNKGNGTTSSGAASSKAAVRGELQPITLRVFMDHSMLEAFTSTGQVGVVCKNLMTRPLQAA